MQVYDLVQAAVSVVRNLEVVCYSGAAIALHIWRFQLVHMVVIGRGPLFRVSVNRESTV